MDTANSSLTPADAALPAHASVVVIGGGVMGCSTLYHLARQGCSDAILLERNQLTSGTTWHSAAQVRALRSTRNLTELIRYSVDLYSRLEKETGQSTGWINRGSLSIATTPDRLLHIRRQQALADLFGVTASEVSAGEAAERWPLMHSGDVIGAVWSPDDGRVSPTDLCAALVKGARAAGARLFENVGVDAIFTNEGRVTGVGVDGHTIRCDAVAVCAGLWSREVAAMSGLSIPVWPCEHYYLLTQPFPGFDQHLPTLSDHDSSLYLRDDSGGLLVGCFEAHARAIDPQRIGARAPFQLLQEDWNHFEPVMQAALHRVPALAEAEVRTLLNGPESFTTDGSFLLGPGSDTEGLYLGCGMNSVGVASGGGAGWALAQNIVEGRLPFDLAELDPRRFADCFSAIRVLAERVPEVLGKHYAISYPGQQWHTARGLRKLPLHALWAEHGAWFGEVAGWERPLCFNPDRPGSDADAGISGVALGNTPALGFAKPAWFESVGMEVAACHEDAALFELSTFGRIVIGGPQALAFLSRISANSLRVADGRIVYTMLLNPRGGIEADAVVLRRSEHDFLLFVGSALQPRVWSWLQQLQRCWQREQVAHGPGAAGEAGVTVIDRSASTSTLALAGPRSRNLLTDLCAVAPPPFYHHLETQLGAINATLACVSYTGEEGFEISVDAADVNALAKTLLARGVSVAGLYAQSSMRIEKAFLAYGHEIDTDTTPLDLGFLQMRGDVDTGDAAAALSQAEASSCVVTLLVEDHQLVVLGNEPVLYDGRIIGKTTSAAYGYRMQQTIALAQLQLPLPFAMPARGSLPPAAGEHSAPPSPQPLIEINLAGCRVAATVQQGPCFDPTGARMRGVSQD